MNIFKKLKAKYIYWKTPIFKINVLKPDTIYDIEHGGTIILYRRNVKYPSPAAAGCINFGSGIAIDIKEGYCGIVQPFWLIRQTGLIPANAPRVILPGNNTEVTLDFWKSEKEIFTKRENSEAPIAIGEIMGYVTIVKSVR